MVVALRAELSRLSVSFRSKRLVSVLAVLAMLAACGTTKPVADGQYRVVKGDTLTQIARKHGQSVSSLMRLNNLRNPNQIIVGQVLKVKGGAVVVPSAGSGKAQPLPPVKGKSVAAPRAIKLVWPAQGNTRRGTEATNTQGVYISAAAGAPVSAAAAGKVMYAGDGLRRYGNMLIIGHDSNFLSVYAHNQKLLVKEGDQVRQGQKIATMGSTGSDRVSLYFELRYDGKAVDALRYLPKQ